MVSLGSPLSPILPSSPSHSLPCSVCNMFSYSILGTVALDCVCSKCELNARLTEKIAELETRIRTLYSIKASKVFIVFFGPRMRQLAFPLDKPRQSLRSKASGLRFGKIVVNVSLWCTINPPFTFPTGSTPSVMHLLRNLLKEPW